MNPIESSDNNLLSQEISPKQVIVAMIKFLNYLLTEWKLILIVAVIGGGLGFFYADMKKPLYIANLSFIVNDGKSSGAVNGALGIASQFGLDIGSGMNNGIFSGENLTAFMKSRSIIEKVLLSPIDTNPKAITLADFYNDIYKLKDKNNSKFHNIKFNENMDRAAFTIEQNLLLSSIYSQIIKHNLDISQKNKKVSFINISVNSLNESFSQLFAEKIIEVVSKFYVEYKTKNSQQNLSILLSEADSVRRKLNESISGVAIANDATYNLNPAFNIKRAPSSKKQIDVQANTAILTQLLQNIEVAKMGLRQETPLIQVLDYPILPLPVVKADRFVYFFSSFLGACFLTIFFLLYKKTIKKIMSSSR